MQVGFKISTYTAQTYNSKKTQNNTNSIIAHKYSNNTTLPYNYHSTYFLGKTNSISPNKTRAYITNVKNALPDLIPENADLDDIKIIMGKNAPEISEAINNVCEDGDIKKLNKEQIKFILEKKLGFCDDKFTGNFYSLLDIQKDPEINMEHSDFIRLHKKLNKLFYNQYNQLEELNKKIVTQRVMALKGIFTRRNLEGITTKAQLSERIEYEPINNPSMGSTLRNILKNFENDEKSKIQKQIIESMFGLIDGKICSDQQIAGKFNIPIEDFENIKDEAIYILRLLKRNNTNSTSMLSYKPSLHCVKTVHNITKNFKKVFPANFFEGTFTKEQLSKKLDEEIISGKSVRSFIKEALSDEEFKKDPDYKLKKRLIEWTYGIEDGYLRTINEISKNRRYIPKDKLSLLQAEAIDQIIKILEQNKLIKEINTIKSLKTPQIINATKPARSAKTPKTLSVESILFKKLYLGKALEKDPQLYKIFNSIKNEEDFINKMNEKCFVGGLSLKEIFEKALKSEKFNDSEESQIHKTIIEYIFGLNDKEIRSDSDIKIIFNKKYKDTELYKNFKDKGIRKALDKLSNVLTREELILQETGMNEYIKIQNNPIDILSVHND